MDRASIPDRLASVDPRRGDGCVNETWVQLAQKFVSAAVLTIVFAGRAAAQSGEKPGYCGGVDVPDAVAVVIDLLNSIQVWGVGIGLAAAAVAYVYAGILLTFGGGDPQRVERAKTVILYATAGIIVVLLSGGLVELVETKICGGLG